MIPSLTLLRRPALALLTGLLLIGSMVATSLHVHPDGLTHQHCAACVSGHAAVDLARPQPAIEPLALDRAPVVIAAIGTPLARATAPARARAPPQG
jgi:hypothetical protein